MVLNCGRGTGCALVFLDTSGVWRYYQSMLALLLPILNLIAIAIAIFFAALSISAASRGPTPIPVAVIIYLGLMARIPGPGVSWEQQSQGAWSKARRGG